VNNVNNCETRNNGQQQANITLGAKYRVIYLLTYLLIRQVPCSNSVSLLKFKISVAFLYYCRRHVILP